MSIKLVIYTENTAKAMRHRCFTKLISGRKDFVVPGKIGGFFESSGNRAIFFFAELNGLFDAGFFELATQAKEDIELGPDLGRIGGALTRADNFQGLKLLPLLFENDDHIRGGAGAQGEE